MPKKQRKTAMVYNYAFHFHGKLIIKLNPFSHCSWINSGKYENEKQEENWANNS